MKNIAVFLCCIILIASTNVDAFEYKFSKDSTANSSFKEGLKLNNSNMYKKAIPYFEKAIQIDPGFAHAYFELAFAYQYTEDKDLAIKYYEEGLELDKDFVHGYVQLAMLYMEKGELSKSYEWLKEGKRLYPEDERINSMLASVENKYGDALKIAEQAKKNGQHVSVGQAGKGVYVGPQYYKNGEIPATPVEQKLFDEYKAKIKHFKDNNVADKEARAVMARWYEDIFIQYNTNAKDFNIMLSKMAYGEIPPDSYVTPSDKK